MKYYEFIALTIAISLLVFDPFVIGVLNNDIVFNRMVNSPIIKYMLSSTYICSIDSLIIQYMLSFTHICSIEPNNDIVYFEVMLQLCAVIMLINIIVRKYII